MKLRKDRKFERQMQARARQAAWAALSPEQQLAQLDRQGHRATKQRARLAAKIEQ